MGDRSLLARRPERRSERRSELASRATRVPGPRPGVPGARAPANEYALRAVRARARRRSYRRAPGPFGLEIVVDVEPRRVGIDPFNKLIDRVPDDNDDNVKKLDRPSGAARGGKR